MTAREASVLADLAAACATGVGAVQLAGKSIEYREAVDGLACQGLAIVDGDRALITYDGAAEALSALS